MLPDSRRVILICLLLGPLTAVTGTQACAMETVTPTPFVETPSTDTWPVYLDMGKVELRIPRNFLLTAAVWKSDRQIAFTIVTTFPGFGGVTSANIESIRSANWGLSLHTINIKRLSGADAAEEWNKRIIRQAIEHGTKSVGQRDVEFNWPAVGDFYIDSFADHKDAVVVGCGYRVPPTRCAGYLDVAPGVVVMYEYDRSLLPEHRAIHMGLTQLFASFLGD